MIEVQTWTFIGPHQSKDMMPHVCRHTRYIKIDAFSTDL